MLRLDISGHLYKIATDKLEKFPDSLLYQLNQLGADKAIKLGLCAGYNPTTTDYFFDRPVHIFPSVLSAYLTGAVHISSTVCTEELRQELQFWKLPMSALNTCCVPKLSDDEKSLWMGRGSPLECPFDGHQRRFYFKFKRSLWYILEKPGSSKVALIFMLVSLLFVLASMCILVLGSIPAFQTRSKSMNVTKTIYELLLADDACVAWFTLEYVLRLLTAPYVIAYVTSWSAVVDLLSFIPTYIEIALSVHNSNNNKNDVGKYMLTSRMIGLLRVFRCLRLVKLIRYSPGLLAIFRTLRKSFRELMLMVLFALTVDLVVATLVYFLEADVENTPFNTIPSAAWWGIVTITTVGYGDMVPSTVGGKLVASATVLTGILILSLPVSIIAENFGVAYAEVRDEFARELHTDDVFSLKTFMQSPWLPRFPEEMPDGGDINPDKQHRHNNTIAKATRDNSLELWRM